MLRFLLAAFVAVVPSAAQTLQAPATANAGQQVEIKFSGAANPKDFITIVERDTPEGKYSAYGYTRARTSVELRAPEEPGAYEVRYLSATSPYATLVRSPLTIKPVTASLQAPATVDAGTDINFTWEGPNNTKDFITVVKKGTPERKYGRYVYSRSGSPAKIRVPDEPGEYELRYLTGGKYSTLATESFTIGALAGATISGPANVKAGAEFSFEWTGPKTKGDFITLVPPNTPPKEYKRYVYARSGSPAKMRAPDEAGEYELRYLSGQSYALLGKAAITVGAVTATVKGPVSVEGGQTFEVTWTGPGNSRDWIAVSPKGANAREYETYAVIRGRNPVPIRAPLTQGEYEIRYQTGQTYSILAKQPIRVGPPRLQPGKLQVISSTANGQVQLAKSTAVEIILDASGSMLQQVGGKRRIEIAKQVLTDLVEKTIPSGTPLALRVFGHKEAGSCRTDLEQPLTPLAPAKTAQLIAGIQAMNLAKTPIGHSLELVAQDLKSNRGERLVVLVTDGEETCGGDAAAAIEKLRAVGFDVRVNIVGFAISDQSLKDTFSYWARLGGGEYFNATSESELGESLVEAVKVRFEAVDDKGQVLAEGLVDGGAVDLPSGVYTVRTQAGEVSNVKVAPNETATATIP